MVETHELSPAVGLSTALRKRTAQLHAQAESSGIIALILTGTVTRSGYALYLRNLLPAYREMEQALERHRTSPGFGYMAQSSLHRAGRIEADLDTMAGPGWPAILPLLSTGRHYAERVRRAGAGNAELLYAYAYTRYLGDLYGGQTLRRHLVRRFGAHFRATEFTEFPAIQEIRRFTADFGAALDEAGRNIANPGPVIEEAAIAFRLNIALSEEVAALHPR
jgi:heme oxygenase (biliverdin-producing, ferredoxin)